MIAIIVLCGSAGNVLISRGMGQVGEVSTLRPGLLAAIGRKVIANRSFLLSIGCMTVSFFAFLAVLSWKEVSFIIPATSLEYVVSTLGAKFILREHISGTRWAGTVLVCLGVAIISLQP